MSTRMLCNTWLQIQLYFKYYLYANKTRSNVIVSTSCLKGQIFQSGFYTVYLYSILRTGLFLQRT